MCASSIIMLRNCGSAEYGVRIRLRTTGFSKPSGAVLGREEDLGHAAVGELAQDGVAAVRGHSRRLGYHPPTAGWRLTASESTTTTTTRAARDTRPRAKRGPRCRPPWVWRPRPPRRRSTSRTPCASCCRAATGRCTDCGGATSCWRTAPRVRSATGALPDELPLGYHRILRRGGDETLLIVSPGRCFLPDDLRTWGFAAQLYAARSRDELGDRRPRGSDAPRPLDARAGRRRADGQPADGADAGAADRSRARTTRRAGATATRSSCASRSCPAGTRCPATCARA